MRARTRGEAANAGKAHRSGFAPIDWEAVDPDNVPDNLIKRFSNNTAAKSWAKYTLPGPLPDDIARSYISAQAKRHQEALQNSQNRVLDAEKTGKTLSDLAKVRLDSRLEAYLALVIDPQPQDVMSLRSLAAIELRLEDIEAQLAKTSMDGEDELRLRKFLNDEWKDLSVQYREYQKSLGITKGQRDAQNEGKSTAELFQQEMARCVAWMAAELDMPRCTCNTEVAWIWHAFKKVHNPTPYYYIGQCECGGLVEVGDRPFATESIGRLTA